MLLIVAASAESASPDGAGAQAPRLYLLNRTETARMGLLQVLPRSHTSCTGPGFVNPNGPAHSHTSCTDPGFVNPNGPALDIQEVNFLTFIQHYNTRSSSPRKHNRTYVSDNLLV